MDLCLDIGNTQLHAGVFDNEGKLLVQFRYNTSQVGSSDQLGVFLINVLRENTIDYKLVKRVAVASVVPSVDYSVVSAFLKYFKLRPLFLKPGIKTGIKISGNKASEIGSDLIAASIGGVELYPNFHLLIFDFGTASTVVYITPHEEFVGGALLPGIKLMMESLERSTEKLFSVNILKPKNAVSKDTGMAIQSGIYYAQVGAIRALITEVTQEYNILPHELKVIATGGFANLLNSGDVFDIIIPDLVLRGLRKILFLN